MRELGKELRRDLNDAWQRIIKGDTNAWFEFVDLCRRKVYDEDFDLQLQRRTNGEVGWDDVFSETLLTLLKISRGLLYIPDDYDVPRLLKQTFKKERWVCPTLPHRSWLSYEISAQPPIDEILEQIPDNRPQAQPSYYAETEDTLAFVRRAIHRLNPDMDALLELCIQEMSFTEICERLRVSRTTLRRKLNSLRQLSEIVLKKHRDDLVVDGAIPKPPSATHEKDRDPQPDSHPTAPDEIDCTVFGPTSIGPTESFVLQLFVHLRNRQAEAEELATQFDPSAGRRGRLAITHAVNHGDLFTFDLYVHDASCDHPRQQLEWRGVTDSVAYVVTANAASTSRVSGRVVVNLRGVPIGQIAFTVRVEQQPASATPTRLGSVEQFHSYFASYATPDRAIVLRCVQVLRLTGRKVRQDVLDLDPGVRWQQRLFEFIRECDATILFWSSNAKASEWVHKECLFCKEVKGVDRLLPYVLEKNPPTPWPEFSEFHMNDPLVQLLQ
jgi:hypothetical protein